MKLSVLVPVYNERYWLSSLWKQLSAMPVHATPEISSVEIVVVDDGSDDGSSALLKQLCASPMVLAHAPAMATEVKLLRNDRNRGKGFAVRKAIAHSTGDVVIIQDSDLEYAPSDYPRLVQPILTQGADAVIGNRFTGDAVRALYFFHYLFNVILNFFANIMNNLTLNDCLSGYKAFRGEILRNLDLRSDRFGIECEIVAKLATAKVRVFEVPVTYNGRTYEEGKKIRPWDGVLMFFQATKYALLQREPFKPGLFQTLTTLDKVSSIIYAPILRKALADVTERKGELKILEIGAGIGSLTKELVKYGDVTATDISDEYVRQLGVRFGHYSGFQARYWDASVEPDESDRGAYDVIVSFNVLEHIENDRSTLRIWQHLLKPGGILIVLVPNMPKLYSPIDKAVGHWRRYTKADLCEKILATDMGIQKVFFGNSLGIAGWILNGLILKKSDLPAGQLWLYSLIKPVIKPIEVLLERHLGLSLIVVSRNLRGTTGRA